MEIISASSFEATPRRRDHAFPMVSVSLLGRMALNKSALILLNYQKDDLEVSVKFAIEGNSLFLQKASSTQDAFVFKSKPKYYRHQGKRYECNTSEYVLFHTKLALCIREVFNSEIVNIDKITTIRLSLIRSKTPDWYELKIYQHKGYSYSRKLDNDETT